MSQVHNQKFLTKILIASAILIVVSFGTLGLWLYSVTSAGVSEEISAEIKVAGSSASDGIQKWLDGRIILARDAMDDIAAIDDPAELKRSFQRPTLASTFADVYMGLQQDGSFIEGPDHVMPAGYDPRKRPWYQDAVSAKKLTLTKPYVDASTHKLVISLAAPLYSGPEVKGVFGADLELDAINDFLKSFNLGGRGFVFLIDEDGTVLVHPEADKVMKPLGIKPSAAANATIEDGGEQIVNFYPIAGLPSVKWYVGVSMDREKVLAPLTSLRRLLVAGMIVALLVVVSLLGWLIAAKVTKPISEITAAMEALAAGRSVTTIPGSQRLDEIGAMAAALGIFREHALERDRLAAERVHAEAAAQEEKRRMLSGLIDRFEQNVSRSVQQVGGKAEGMERTAQVMSGHADRTRDQAGSAANVTGEVTEAVQTVASAAEELSASIGEISRQVAQSSHVTQLASQEADRTNITMKELAETSARIGEVVNLINDIAAQTNLLALNATIEAARAGEAGKGFAVVANEVKHLASQTAKATEEISAQIGAVQGATKEAVGAILGIVTRIQEIHGIATAVASAVEEQSAATAEIARNVQHAAAGTRKVADNIEGVTRSAQETGSSANEVLTSARSLAQDAVQLKEVVANFVASVNLD